MRPLLVTAILVGLIVAGAAFASVRPDADVSAAQDAADGASSCAYVVRWSGRTYEGHAVMVSPRQGRPLGDGVAPACNDSDGPPKEPDAVPLAAFPGLAPRDVVVPRHVNDVVLVRRGLRSLPPEVRRLQRAPRCESPGRVRLRGPWLGILGADGRTEVDLVPPYDLHVHVRTSSHPRYRRAFLDIRVRASLGRPITRADVENALWKPGEIAATVRCGKRGHYVATRVTAHPR